MKIVLTGFMGSGKTFVGKALSRSLGYSFIDTDTLIEEREDKPISLIFKEKGEDYFRRLECSVIEEVSLKNDVVIATGGGVIKDIKNVRNLGRRGIIIRLKASPEIVLKRVMLEGGKRPLLDVKEPLDEIKRLLKEREGFYGQSDISIGTDFITPGEAAHEIIEKLSLDTQKVTVGLEERSYEIIIGKKIIHKLGPRLKEFRPSRVAIVSNKTVFPIFGDIIQESLKQCGIKPEILLIPDGEEYKDSLRVSYLYGELLKHRFDRDSLIVALGGGVVGDIAGFAASTYMRGIKYVQVPTTLLAQVDSSVGGKTGVNHPLGKNMIGTFYQPSLVFIDVDTLKTLPVQEFKSGIAEVIKYGVIADREFFDSLESDAERVFSFGDSLTGAIKRSCEIKADVVSRDEKEEGLRAILNFGHTVGHAIETVTDYKRFLHGEAIAIGMCSAVDLALRLKIIKNKDVKRIKDLIKKYKLPTQIPEDIDVSDIINAMELDKKVKSKRLRFVLPEAIGKVRIVDDVDREIIREVLIS